MIKGRLKLDFSVSDDLFSRRKAHSTLSFVFRRFFFNRFLAILRRMVGVVVIHTVGFALHAVQDDAFDIDLVLTQTVGTDFKLSGGGVAVAADQQNRTCQLSDDSCVGHCEDRRGVDNHVVVTFLGVCRREIGRASCRERV